MLTELKTVTSVKPLTIEETGPLLKRVSEICSFSSFFPQPTRHFASSQAEFVLCLTNSDLTAGGLESLTRESGAGIAATSGSVYTRTALQMEAFIFKCVLFRQSIQFKVLYVFQCFPNIN